MYLTIFIKNILSFIVFCLIYEAVFSCFFLKIFFPDVSLFQPILILQTKVLLLRSYGWASHNIPGTPTRALVSQNWGRHPPRGRRTVPLGSALKQINWNFNITCTWENVFDLYLMLFPLFTENIYSLSGIQKQCRDCCHMGALMWILPCGKPDSVPTFFL